MRVNSSDRINKNVTQFECLYVPQLSENRSNYPMISFQVITMLIAITGNLITILTILRRPKLRKNVTYIFILSVSIADFLIGLVAQPLFIANIITLASNVYICKAGVLTGLMFGSASITGIIGITLERFVYIMHPLKCKRILTRKRATVLIAIFWCVGIMLCVLHLFWYDVMAVQVSNFLLIAITTLVTLVANINFLYLSRTTHRTLCSSSDSSTNSTIKQTQMTCLILKICLAFGVCWIPYGIIGLKYATVSADAGKDIVIAYYWGIAIGFSNSALNVLIYAKGNTVLKYEIKRFLRLQTNDMNLVRET